MENLFEKWKLRIPKYSVEHKDLFSALSQKYGAEGEKKAGLGKHFSTNYELYMYAFFLGLYTDKLEPIPEGQKKTDFSHAIQHWGSKSAGRENFTGLQENMFMTLVAATDIEIQKLEKGEIEEDEVVKQLIQTMESFTNGGLLIIRDKLQENSNYFIRPTSMLELILSINVEN